MIVWSRLKTVVIGRAYLERCLAVIDVLEGEIKACAALNIEVLVPQRMR